MMLPSYVYFTFTFKLWFSDTADFFIGELSEEDKLDMAAAPDPAATDAAIAAAMAATVDAEADVPIDENLFGDDDLEMLDDDLEQLDLE